MKINIVFNKNIDNYSENLEKLNRILEELNVNFKTFDLDSMKEYGNLTIALGGDGTILKVAKFYSKTHIPVLGVNLGRLGFLSQVNLENLKYAITKILTDNFHIESRLMLESDNYIALNDFVIKGCTQSRTSKFYLEINGENVCDYIADGIIISTPTGSTAYGLSAGGPVLHPTLDAIIIVPICPHTLNARPLVIPTSDTIKIKTGDKPLSISVDGFETGNCVNEIVIKASAKKACLAFLDKEGFYSVIRNKLHWGISPEK